MLFAKSVPTNRSRGKKQLFQRAQTPCLQKRDMSQARGMPIQITPVSWTRDSTVIPYNYTVSLEKPYVITCERRCKTFSATSHRKTSILLSLINEYELDTLALLRSLVQLIYNEVITVTFHEITYLIRHWNIIWKHKGLMLFNRKTPK